MLTAEILEALPQLPPPVLTAYLDTNPANPRNQGAGGGRAVAAWLRSHARLISERFPDNQQRAIAAQAQRLSERLAGRSSGSKALVAFVGPSVWKLIPLQVEVDEELHWGPPALAQLLWLYDEHQPSGISVLSRSGARFLVFRMGEVEELPHRPLILDTSQWRPQSLVMGVGKEQDQFESRVESHYEQFFREVADYCRSWFRHDRLQALLLLGNDKAIATVAAHLPETLHSRVISESLNPARLTRTEIVRLAEPRLAALRRQLEDHDVSQLLEERHTAVHGIDQTLSALREHKVRLVVAAHQLPAQSEGPEAATRPLRTLVPELVRASGAAIEIVAGPAADHLLRDAEGLAAWLRSAVAPGPEEQAAA